MADITDRQKEKRCITVRTIKPKINIMKKLLIVLLSTTLLSSCTPDKTKIVEDVIKNINSKNYKESSDNLVENFEFIKFNVDSVYDKTYFMESLKEPSIKDNNLKYDILNIIETDSTVSTTERQYTPWDTILNTKTFLELKKTYYFTGDKISKIVIDTMLNNEEHTKEIIELSSPFSVFAEEKYGEETKKYSGEELQKFYSENMISYLTEYSKLPDEVKHQYKLKSTLKGMFVDENDKEGLKLEFKGKSIVDIYDGWMWNPYTSSYKIDEDYVVIDLGPYKPLLGDLLLRIKNSTTLVGEGKFKGTYIKVE